MRSEKGFYADDREPVSGIVKRLRVLWRGAGSQLILRGGTVRSRVAFENYRHVGCQFVDRVIFNAIHRKRGTW